MSKHTPAPWTATTSVGKQLLSYSQTSAVHGECEHRQQLICGCFGDVAGGESQAKANANLIAAAPELLAALEHALRILDTLFLEIQLNDGNPSHGLIEARKKSVSAIRKARGES